MRLVCSIALAASLAATTAGRAEDPPKSEGMIGLKLDVKDGKVVVVEAIEKSPADKAGIKADDVLLKINEYKVKDKAEKDDVMAAVKEVGKYKPGEKVKITVKRADAEKTIEVTVGKRAEIIKD
jgi:C-terminal processing protease CtpA/Prc